MVKMPNAAQAASQGPISDPCGALPGFAPREPVDDPAEQHRLGELRHRERDVGEHEPGREPLLRPEPRQNAGVKPEKLMEAPSSPIARNVFGPRCF